jgi:hypothetical protein
MPFSSIICVIDAYAACRIIVTMIRQLGVERSALIHCTEDLIMMIVVKHCHESPSLNSRMGVKNCY